MTPRAPVSIVGFAGCTSLGYSLGATLAAMGAGLSNFTDTGIKNLFGTPASAGALLDHEIPRVERLPALASIALAELQVLLLSLGLKQVPFMVGVASDLSREEESALQREVLEHPCARPAASWFPYGRASSLIALAHAADLIGQGTHPFVVVGGIDSLCAPDTVQALVNAERVLGPHTEGTIPGEAAVFALLARSDNPLVDRSRAVAVDAVVQERAPVTILQADRASGDGLASAFRAFRQSGAQRVDRIVAGHSGEGYFGHSFSHAYLREVEIMPEPLRLDLTADCAGDVGSASGILALAFGLYLMVSDQRDDEGRLLAYSESDTGEIGAAIIEGSPTSWQPGAAV